MISFDLLQSLSGFLIIIVNITSYYYLDDSKSDLGYTPVPEEEMLGAILSIAKKHGLEITDKMILDQIEKKAPHGKHTG